MAGILEGLFLISEYRNTKIQNVFCVWHYAYVWYQILLAVLTGDNFYIIELDNTKLFIRHQISIALFFKLT